MRLTFFVALMLSACATLSPRAEDTSGIARTYDFSEEKTQALVRAAFEKRGVTFTPSTDPHVWLTAPIDRTTRRVRTGAFALGGAAKEDQPSRAGNSGDDFSDLRAWRVTFSPNGSGTKVMVERAERYGWSDQAERISGGAFDDPAKMGAAAQVETRSTAATPFVRDRETEAVIAAEIDGSADLEVSQFHEESLDEVMPLPDPAEPAPAADFQPNIVEADPCPSISDALTPMVAAGHLILLGDPFGAHEPWEALERLSCGVAALGVPLTIALPLPRSEQASLNAFLTSAGTAVDRKALVSTPFWQRPWQDGRSARANAFFIEHVRARRAAGAKLNLLAVEPNASGNLRQAGIAAAILRYREQNPNRLIVVMAGNVNISKRKGTEWDPELYPFGARLAAVLPEKTRAFDVSFEPGHHWTCHSTGGGAMKCGTWSAQPGPSQRLGSLQLVRDFRLFERTSPEGFDGVYYVGALSASAPAGLPLFDDQGTAMWRGAEDPFITP